MPGPDNNNNNKDKDSNNKDNSNNKDKKLVNLKLAAMVLLLPVVAPPRRVPEDNKVKVPGVLVVVLDSRHNMKVAHPHGLYDERQTIHNKDMAILTIFIIIIIRRIIIIHRHLIKTRYNNNNDNNNMDSGSKAILTLVGQ